MATALLEPRTVAANTSTRRNILSFFGAVGVAAAAPAITVASMRPAPATVFARYLAAEARMNALPDEYEFERPAIFDQAQNEYIDALITCKAATPKTLREFAIWYSAVGDDSELAKRTIDIINDLAANERVSLG